MGGIADAGPVGWRVVRVGAAVLPVELNGLWIVANRG
jgi:hypothetical protein